MKQIYIAGDMLSKESRWLRDQERESINKIEGVQAYCAQDDKEINDKKNQTEESNNGLAEKIVKKDTKAIIESDAIVIEPKAHALGTITELGQLKGMKDAYLECRSYVAKTFGAQAAKEMQDHFGNSFIKPVYAHYEDERRTDIKEAGDRRSFGVNQYVYGVALDLTDGAGFLEFEELLRKIEEDHNA